MSEETKTLTPEEAQNHIENQRLIQHALAELAQKKTTLLMQALKDLDPTFDPNDPASVEAMIPRVNARAEGEHGTDTFREEILLDAKVIIRYGNMALSQVGDKLVASQPVEALWKDAP